MEELDSKNIETNIKHDCCIYTNIEDFIDIPKEDKTLISAEFGTRFGFENKDKDNNKD